MVAGSSSLCARSVAASYERPWSVSGFAARASWTRPRFPRGIGPDCGPEPVGAMWAKMRAGVDEAIRKRISDFGGWRLSGGTILAAQWHHRDSTDVDLKVAPKTGLVAPDPRYDAGFDREMMALGVGPPVHRQDQIIIPVGKAKIDIFEAPTTPVVGEERILGGQATRKGAVEQSDPERKARRTKAREPHARPVRRRGGGRTRPVRARGRRQHGRRRDLAGNDNRLAGDSHHACSSGERCATWRAGKVGRDSGRPGNRSPPASEGRTRYTRVRIRFDNNEVEIATECARREARIERVDGSTRAKSGNELDRQGVKA